MKICHFLFEPCTLSRLTTVHNNVTLVRADCVYATVSIYMSSDHLPAVSLYISYCILMEWKYNKIYKEMDFLDINDTTLGRIMYVKLKRLAKSHIFSFPTLNV